MYQQVIDFWFKEISSSQWWAKDQAFDSQIKTRFGNLHNQAVKGELWQWRETPHGSLAEIIVIDQFSRNIYRDKPESFLYDGMALVLAQTAVNKKFDQLLNTIEQSFLYLPYMHSESALIHEEAVKLYSASPGLEYNYDFELKHKLIIDRFGRYPHRNQILGRVSTPEEEKFLLEPGSSF
ncbi:DUF924 family protein [Aquella oligotrophica]|uniref:DUF924 domain-containing protein n=1 Tax=Aquella oligotrophica TaxID=2067065 RepID=A0A2I7N635_9NEIS|nr:DUF924 family protein [Aquella oligotrophica]AUR51902.1 DUF924 domain-containing protein [Aquella oligotrophica]